MTTVRKIEVPFEIRAGLKIPVSPAAGQVLTSDALGNASWQAVPTFQTATHSACMAVSKANENVASPGASIGGVPMVAGARVLLTAQTTGSQNGIWVWNGNAVAMTRPTDWTGTLSAGGHCVPVLMDGNVMGTSEVWFGFNNSSISSTIVVGTDTSGWQIVAPGGNAGGALTGTYPNPQLAGAVDMMNPGVANNGDFAIGFISASAFSIAAGTAWGLVSGVLQRSVSAGGNVTGIPAASASNFRLDQIYIDIPSGAIGRVAGTQGTTVTLDNRTGAGAIPAGGLLLFDVLVDSTGVALARTQDRRLWAPDRVERVTSLPTDAVTGRMIDYVADAANGVIWRFRARRFDGTTGARNTSTLPWECVGGSDMAAEVTTSETTSSTTYAALATAGPSVTVPLAGDYDVEIGAHFTAAATNVIQANMSYDIGATAAADIDRCMAGKNAWASTDFIAANRMRRKTGLAAGTALVAKYKCSAAGTMTAAFRWMRVKPVRVG